MTMSKQKDALCSPPTATPDTSGRPDDLQSQLESLRLKVSPAMQAEVSNVLESLTGERDESRLCMGSLFIVFLHAGKWGRPLA